MLTGIYAWEKKRHRRQKISNEQQEELEDIVTEKCPQDFGADQSRF